MSIDPKGLRAGVIAVKEALMKGMKQQVIIGEELEDAFLKAYESAKASVCQPRQSDNVEENQHPVALEQRPVTDEDREYLRGLGLDKPKEQPVGLTSPEEWIKKLGFPLTGEEFSDPSFKATWRQCEETNKRIIAEVQNEALSSVQSLNASPERIQKSEDFEHKATEERLIQNLAAMIRKLAYRMCKPHLTGNGKVAKDAMEFLTAHGLQGSILREQKRESHVVNAQAMPDIELEPGEVVYVAPAPGWQPIETAPRDEWVLIFADHASNPAVAFCGFADENDGVHEGKWVWMDSKGSYWPHATHWMPLPETPEEQGRRGFR